MPQHKHYLLHKPYGYISQFIYDGKRNKKLLGELFNFAEGTMAIGRLDEKSEGLLLLTTDGKVSELIRSNKVEKEYYIQLDGIISDEAISQLKNGVLIGIDGEKYMTQPCVAAKIETPDFLPRIRKIRDDRHGPTSWATITVKEGKFRQIRKMTAAVGFPVLRLVRIRVGEMRLNELRAGEVVEVANFLEQ